ncbi:calcium/calmodulin-dependent protein kinase kinase 2-like [Convolutriloba macropyga]|uniref:calcium/calmodulin-dependent protein kinase kinase 2-like n=1 Tax=Convolutriloba macropyga TaxID=536237 RepID=UPI003F522B2C
MGSTGWMYITVRTPLDQVYAEISTLKKLHHPHIVKLHEVYDEEASDDLCMVFEFLPGGSVLPDIPTENTLTETKARKYFVHTFLAMEYLHHQKIIHRDIKPENILLDARDHAKLVDLGESIEFQGEEDIVRGTKGTPGFLAPELVDLDSPSHDRSRGRPVDIWAIGVTLYAMLFGNIPFDGQTKMELYENIANQPLKIPDEPTISHSCRKFLTRLLEKDPKERITVDGIRGDEWFKGYEGKIPSIEENRGSVVSVSAEDIENCVSRMTGTEWANISTIARIKSMLMRKRSSRLSGLVQANCSGSVASNSGAPPTGGPQSTNNLLTAGSGKSGSGNNLAPKWTETEAGTPAD